MITNKAGESNVFTKPIGFLPAGPVTLSLWMQAVSQANTRVWLDGSNSVPPLDVTQPDPKWVRRSRTGENFGLPDNVATIDPSFNANAIGHFLLVAGFQVEVGSYPTSVIMTIGTPVTREAERLSTTKAAEILADKLVDVTLTYSPLYADGEMMADHDLIYLDAGTRLYATTKGEIILKTASGTTTLSTDTPPLWKRGSEIKIHATFGPAERSMQVTIDGNGPGPTTNVGGALPSVSQIFILGNAGGAQESADLRSLTIE